MTLPDYFFEPAFPDLILFALNLALLPVWVWKRNTNNILAGILLFFLLLIPVLYAINQPNQQLTIG